MWQKFSTEARQIVRKAQEEASKRNDSFISNDHFMLAICETPESTGFQLLERLSIHPSVLRQAIEDGIVRNGHAKRFQFTPVAKRTIDLAYGEARNLNVRQVASEHLLLAIVREGESLGARALIQLGADYSRIYEHISGLPYHESKRPLKAARHFGSAASKRELFREKGPVLSGTLILTIWFMQDSPHLTRFLNNLGLGLGEVLAGINSSEKTASKEVSLDTFLPLAQKEAELAGQTLNSAHIVAAMAIEGDNEIARFFARRSISIEQIREALLDGAE